MALLDIMAKNLNTSNAAMFAVKICEYACSIKYPKVNKELERRGGTQDSFSFLLLPTVMYA